MVSILLSVFLNNSVGTGGALTLADNPAAAATAAVGGITGIPVTDDELYSVYEYAAIDGGDVTTTTGTKNTVYKFMSNNALLGGGAGYTDGTTLIFILDSPIAETSNQTAGGVLTSTKYIETETGKQYTLGHANAFEAGTAKMYYTVGDTYCTVREQNSSTLFNFTASGP